MKNHRPGQPTPEVGQVHLPGASTLHRLAIRLSVSVRSDYDGRGPGQDQGLLFLEPVDKPRDI